jgi:hypothetical protein
MRIIAALLIAGVTACGCAARLQPTVLPDTLGDAERAAVMRDYVGQLPAGSRIKVETTDGTRFTGTLLSVDRDRVVVQPHGRLAEPSRALPIASLRVVEPAPAGANGSLGKAIAIGVVAGAASFLAMLLVALAAVD